MKTRSRVRPNDDPDDSPPPPQLRRSDRRRGAEDKNLAQALLDDKRDKEAARVAASQERELVLRLPFACY